MTKVELTLWPASVRTHRLLDQIAAAGTAGFSSLAINAATYKSAVSSGISAHTIRSTAKEHGVRFKWIDAVSGWLPIRYPSGSPELKEFLDHSLDSAFEIADELGAEGLLAIGCFNAGAIPSHHQTAAFESLCRQAQARDLLVGLEFIPIWGIPDLKSAWEIVSAVDAPNGGLVIDTWHFFRSHSQFDLLKQIPSNKVFAVQLADALERISGQNLLDDCLSFRRLPGQGELPLPTLMDLFRGMNVSDFGPEVFSTALDRLSALEAATLCIDATRSLLVGGEGWPAQSVATGSQ